MSQIRYEKLLEERGGLRGSMPFYVAATYKEEQAVRILLNVGAGPNERDDYRESGIQ